MREHRNLKVASVIEKKLGLILVRDYNFEGAVVTVLTVEVSPDLLQAKIGLGVLPKDKEAEAVMALNRDHKRLEHLLLKQMRLRIVPKLIFKIGS
ncbi:MAG TPA: ribosome-binding factor A [Candidatus Paceibacterota bacterium]|nr:ribosome-binding factor A [Candidatus Paceibacterota bacterium]